MKLQSEHYYNPYFEYLVQSGFFFLFRVVKQLLQGDTASK